MYIQYGDYLKDVTINKIEIHKFEVFKIKITKQGLLSRYC